MCLKQTIASWRSLVSPAALLLLIVAALGGYVIASHGAATAAQKYVTLAGSVPSVPQSAHLSGQHASSGQLTISVALHPNNATEMNNLLAALYDSSRVSRLFSCASRLQAVFPSSPPVHNG